MIRYRRWAKVLGISPDTHKGIARCPRVGKCVSTFAQQKEMPNPQGGAVLEHQNIINENEILAIAWQSVESRREKAKHSSYRITIDGTEEETGYVRYDDFDQYARGKGINDKKVSDFTLRKLRFQIRNVLISNRWSVSAHRPETRFYPPGPANKSKPNLIRPLFQDFHFIL
jgi:hypothetical protein